MDFVARPVHWPRRGTVPIYVPKDDHVGRIYASGSWYEADLLAALQESLRGRPGVCIDVGAHLGGHSVFFAEIMSREVIAFEPNPALYPCLQMNAKGRKIKAFNLGLGAREGRASVLPGPEGNTGMAHLGEGDDVDVCTLDRFLWAQDDYPMVALIKIDVEGMEPEVLAGADRTLRRCRPVVTTEVGTPEEEAKVRAVFAALKEAGGPRYVAREQIYCRTPTLLWEPRRS